MLANHFSIREDFPPVPFDQWRTLAEADLKGAPFDQKLVTHTYEGIDIQPVYSHRDYPGDGDPQGFPGLPPFVRGSQPWGTSAGWDLRQEHAHPDLDVTNAAIHEDLRGGVTSLLLRLDFAARNGYDPDHPAGSPSAGRDGLMIYDLDDLDHVLRGVSLEQIGITLEAGAAFYPASALLAALWARRGVVCNSAMGAFNADPWAVLARDGMLPYSTDTALDLLARLTAWTADQFSHVTAVRVGTAPYHHAGATTAQDLAFAIATGVDYLRGLTARGVVLNVAARQIQFSISVGTHHFLAIAKLRAARRLWGRAVQVCGGSAEAAAMRLHSRMSKRVVTTRDPHVNILRNTACVFAAGLGGANAITSVPFDSGIGLPDSSSRRIARNTVLISQDEAHLHRVIDPAGGSWYLSWLTDEVAAKAWAMFQQIEQQGGMLAALQSGWIVEQIDSAFAPREKNLARRRDGITGVSEFPDARETPYDCQEPDRQALLSVAVTRRKSTSSPQSWTRPGLSAGDNPEAAALAAQRGATIGQLSAALGFHEDTTVLAPISPHPFAEPFESLRDAADGYVARHGHRPRVFLANMGPIAQHTARGTYAQNFFEAGGFEVGGNDGFRAVEDAVAAFTANGARIATICSSDKVYPDVVPRLAPQLKQAGARTVVLAGNPGVAEIEYRKAGVDRFIFIKCDVLATLRELLQEEGAFE